MCQKPVQSGVLKLGKSPKGPLHQVSLVREGLTGPAPSGVNPCQGRAHKACIIVVVIIVVNIGVSLVREGPLGTLAHPGTCWNQGDWLLLGSGKDILHSR